MNSTLLKHKICLDKKGALQFYEELFIIKRMNDFEKAVARFEDLCKRFEKKYSAYIKTLISRKEQYSQYIKYPEPVRKISIQQI